MFRKISGAGMVLVLAALLLAGCSKVNQENYNRLKVGMSFDEVTALLGQADECSSAMGLKNCTWGSPKKHINVQFAGQKVLLYSGQGLN